jgi:hypothetical protein
LTVELRHSFGLLIDEEDKSISIEEELNLIEKIIQNIEKAFGCLCPQTSESLIDMKPLVPSYTRSHHGRRYGH